MNEIGVVALVSADHASAGTARLRFSDLRDMPLLLFAGPRSFSSRAIREACYVACFERTVIFESPSAAVVAALAGHGVGIAMLAEDAVPARLSGRLIPVVEDAGRLRPQSWMCWRDNHALPPLAESFVETTRRVLAERGTWVSYPS